MIFFVSDPYHGRIYKTSSNIEYTNIVPLCIKFDIKFKKIVDNRIKLLLSGSIMVINVGQMTSTKYQVDEFKPVKYRNVNTRVQPTGRTSIGRCIMSPRSESRIERREKNIPKGPFNTTTAFVEKPEKSLSILEESSHELEKS